MGNERSGFGGQWTVQTTGSGELMRSRERSSSQLFDWYPEVAEGQVQGYGIISCSNIPFNEHSDSC